MSKKKWVKLTRVCTATAAVIFAAMVIPAQGAVVVEARQTSGGAVEISGGGTLNLEAWSDRIDFPTSSRIIPAAGEIVIGPPGRFQLDVYRAVENLSGPPNYGPGRLADPDFGTGDVFKDKVLLFRSE